jgi:penicillin-binding protein 2
VRSRLLPFQGPRLVFFSVVMLATFVVLVGRLYEWQFVRYNEFLAGAQENAIQSVPLPAPRGVIYDRYGVELALNAPAFNVDVIPANLPDDETATLDVLNRLSALIDVPATRAAADAAGKRDIRSLQEMVKEGEGIAPYRPVVVKTDVDQRIAQSILEDNQNLPGVQVEWGSVRQYPNGALTSQIIGYLGPIGAEEAEKLRQQGYNPAFERVGYAGVEAFLEDDLAGKRGLETRVVDVAGLPVRVVKRDEPVAGKSVRLTIDTELQKLAQEAIANMINHINARETRTVTQAGTVIALNPKTGEILAMVSWPTYDNSRFARVIDADYYLRVLNDPEKPFINHAISARYPPGSVWKLLTATGVAQEKVIDPKATLFDGGDLYVENSFAKNDPGSRQRFVCWFRKGHGEVDLLHGIAWSCDVYFYQIGGGNPEVPASKLRPGGLGIEDLDRYATMFGIGSRLGIELPGEEAGRMPDPDWKRRVHGESWSTGDTYNASFGQGYVTVTPLQLINAVAAIANGGTLYQPTVVNSWLDAEGNVLKPLTPVVERTLVLPTDGRPPILNLREDMYIQGKNSVDCICDPRSPFNDPTDKLYDPNQPKCTEDLVKNYKATARIDRDPNPNDDIHDWQDIEYTVNVPYGYNYSFSCNPLLFNPDYHPPFVDPANLSLIQQGMRGAVTLPGGTARILQTKMGYVEVAGKTGTAEYCDDIANKQGLCIPGSWPAHAWFVGYAPYNDPEIMVIAFVYHGGEGAINALPVVGSVMNCYFRLKGQRSQSGGKGPVTPCPDTQTDFYTDTLS